MQPLIRWLGKPELCQGFKIRWDDPVGCGANKHSKLVPVLVLNDEVGR